MGERAHEEILRYVPHVSMSTTNFPWNDLGLNPKLPG